MNRKRSCSRGEVVIVVESSDDDESTSVEDVSLAVTSFSVLNVTYFSSFSK